MSEVSEPSAAHTAVRDRVSIANTILLGAVSVLVAFSAFQAAQYNELSQDLDSVANRMLVESLNDSQESYTEQAIDAIAWMMSREAIAAKASEELVGHLESYLSDNWLGAVNRWQARLAEGEATGFEDIALDDYYQTAITVESRVTLVEVANVRDAAREATLTASRQTGSSVIYSAALLLLTIASGNRQLRVALILIPTAIGIVAIGVWVGWAEILLPF